MYTVKQVAEQIGISSESIRYYTREGFVEPRRDTNNGYRYYSNDDIRLIGFIRKAKTYGLTIHEIREILDKSSAGESPCALVKAMVKKRYQQIHDKITDLQILEKRIEKSLVEWESKDYQTYTNDVICPLIEDEALISLNGNDYTSKIQVFRLKKYKMEN